MHDEHGGRKDNADHYDTRFSVVTIQHPQEQEDHPKISAYHKWKGEKVKGKGRQREEDDGEGGSDHQAASGQIRPILTCRRLPPDGKAGHRAS